MIKVLFVCWGMVLTCNQKAWFSGLY